jgi:alkylated DNA repair protein alkB family protein 6
MYTKYLHGIAMSREEDTVTESIANRTTLGTRMETGIILKRNTRVSLTVRHVPKTFKMKLKIGK